MSPALGLSTNQGDFVLGKEREPKLSFSPNDFWPTQTISQRSAAHLRNYEYSNALNGWLRSMAITLQSDPFMVRLRCCYMQRVVGLAGCAGFNLLHCLSISFITAQINVDVNAYTCIGLDDGISLRL